MDDAIDLFFLQIQGSGRVELENGEIVRVGYSEEWTSLQIRRQTAGRARRIAIGKSVNARNQDMGAAKSTQIRGAVEAEFKLCFFRELPAYGAAGFARRAADSRPKPCC